MPIKKKSLESYAAVLEKERKKSESFSDAKTRKEKKKGAQGTRINSYKDT